MSTGGLSKVRLCRLLFESAAECDEVLMGSDAPPDRYEGTKGFSVSLGIDDTAEAERIFHTLAENGTVRMPRQQNFWAVRFGMLVDQFGIPWMVNCEQSA